MRSFEIKDGAPAVVSLFLSASTLICCAIPALLTSLGMGVVLAGLVSDFPQIVWLSEHKIALFISAGIMLAIAGFSLWRARHMPCPADPAQAKACTRLRKVSWYIYGFSVLAFATGAFFAFIAPYILI